MNCFQCSDRGFCTDSVNYFITRCKCSAGDRFVTALMAMVNRHMAATESAAAIQDYAKRSGVDKLTDDEINAEIKAARSDRKLKNGMWGPWPKIEGYHSIHCLACNIEAAIGTVEDPHPVPEDLHTCQSIRSPSKKTPADRLVEAVETVVMSPNTPPIQADRLRSALEEYRSARNARPSVEDARFLLDALTDGALSALICRVRDHYITDLDDPTRSILRSLGEKID
jgi:hypothetical protein